MICGLSFPLIIPKYILRIHPSTEFNLPQLKRLISSKKERAMFINQMRNKDHVYLYYPLLFVFLQSAFFHGIRFGDHLRPQHSSSFKTYCMPGTSSANTKMTNGKTKIGEELKQAIGAHITQTEGHIKFLFTSIN